jgi:hypothetical protein
MGLRGGKCYVVDGRLQESFKMQLMPVKNIYITAMILRNAYVTTNGGTTAEYFHLLPPPFETWCGGGPAN